MKRLELKPDGFPCKLKECPPGLFLCSNEVAMKTEYGIDEAYCDSGERFWGEKNRGGKTEDTVVQPLIAQWIDDEDC
jgi:hypothetical protein